MAQHLIVDKFQELRYELICNEQLFTEMSSPLQPFLFKDEKGDYRLYLSGWQPRTFNATNDSMYKQGRDWPQAMRKIGDPSQKLTLEEAGEALDAALKYYQPTKQKK